MKVEEAIKIADELTFVKTEKHLNDLQMAILKATWENLTYAELAARRRWTEGYIRQGASKLWKLLSYALGEEVSQTNFRAVLERRGYAQLGEVAPPSEVLSVNWEEKIDVSVFYGREQELKQLRQYIVNSRCRLVALVGMGGIGKTALSVRCVQQIQDKFDLVIWRSLRYAPPLKELLTQLLQLLSGQRETPTTVESGISRLISYFRHQRTLVILDQFETILHPGKLAGQYLHEHQVYQELIRRVVVESHQSCLLLVSREKAQEITILANSTKPCGCLHLMGLGEAAREILNENGLPEHHQWNELIKMYRGNPLALKIVAATIQEVFGGSVTDFLRQSTLFLGDFSLILEQHFSRLTDLEKKILYLLVIENEPVTLPTLQENIGLGASTSELIQALSSLFGRSLLEKSTSANSVHFTLQPLVMKYVTERLIEELCEEIQLAINTNFSETAKRQQINLLLNLNTEKYQKFLSNAKEKLQRRFVSRGEESIATNINKLLSILPQPSRSSDWQSQNPT